MRRLREDADLSGKQLAERLEWPASKVSRLEHGKQTARGGGGGAGGGGAPGGPARPGVADVQAWASATGLTIAATDEFVEDLRSLRIEYATWRRQLRTGFAGRQRVAQLLEDGSVTLRDLQTAVVPGLLQTGDYARALFRGLAEMYGPRDVEAAVHERLRRQEVLYQPGRDLRFLVTEAALRTRVGVPGVHRAQLDRLVAVAGLNSVRLAVLPWSVELPKAVTHNFVLFDDRLVLVETFNAELAVRDAEDVALYARLFELFWDAAAHGEQASALITRIALELPDPRR